MKRNPFLLVAFLLVLCLGSPLLSSGNMIDIHTNKGFSLSDQWNDTGNTSVGFDLPEWVSVGNTSVGFDTYPYGIDTSTYSQSYFNETTQDDILYYPDAGAQEATAGNVTGGTETNTYLSMAANDSISWGVNGTGSDMDPYYLYFDVDTLIASEVYLSYECTGTEYFDLYLYNNDGSDILIDSCFSETVQEALVLVSDFMDYSFNGRHTFYWVGEMDATGDNDIWSDYFHITPHSGYTETFSDGSEWSYKGRSGIGVGEYGDYFNGDTWEMWILCDSASGEYTYYEYDFTDFASSSNLTYSVSGYVESSSKIQAQARLYYTDSSFENLYFTTEYNTVQKLVLEDNKTLDKFWIFADDNPNGISSGNWSVYLDYIRIDSDYLQGVQHDCSTTQGLGVENGASISSDGDLITVVNDASSQIRFYPDFTSSIAYAEPDHYQFLEVYFDSDSIGADFALYSYNGSYEEVQTRTTISKNSYRYNLDSALFSHLQYLRMYFYDSDTIKLDFVQIYSIADFTVSHSGTSTDDYLYVENDTLYCSGTSFTSISLDHNPTILVTSPYYGWAVNNTLGVPEADFYNGSEWIGYSDELEGNLLRGSNTTDFRFKFTDSGNIISLTFYNNFGWINVGFFDAVFRIKSWYALFNIIVRISVEVFVGGFEAALMLGGLIMIPASTLYLAFAVKYRDEHMSIDSILIFLLLFFVGWALFLGGIM